MHKGYEILTFEFTASEIYWHNTSITPQPVHCRRLDYFLKDTQPLISSLNNSTMKTKSQPSNIKVTNLLHSHSTLYLLKIWNEKIHVYNFFQIKSYIHIHM